MIDVDGHKRAEETEAELDHTWKKGIQQGLETASNILLQASKEAYGRDCDSEARLLRTMAKNMKGQAEKERAEAEEYAKKHGLTHK